MNKLRKLFAILAAAVVLTITLASCGSDAGVSASMEYTSTLTKITITTTFASNSKLTSGDAVPYIYEYSYDSDGEESYEQRQKVSFDSSNTRTTTTFSSLEKDTSYLFKLYVEYNSKSTLVTTLEAKTASIGDEDAPIEITTVDEFLAMVDDTEANYKLANDLDFSDAGSVALFTSSSMFEGTFDGDGHTISNITLASATDIGIFGYASEATIKNLNIDTVVVDQSSGRGNAEIGAVAGTLESCTVENVNVKNVAITISGNTTAVIPTGGFVGKADKSTFTNCSAQDVTISFTRLRQRVSVGLFAGILTGDSVGTKIVDDKEVALLADSCYAQGSITGCLYYISTSSTSEAFAAVGGFAGVDSSKSLLTNSYCEADIVLTRATSASYTNDYNLYVGGFVGTNGEGSIKITKCLANSDISVYSGDALDVNADTYETDKETLLETALVSADRGAYIGGFAGYISGYFDSIKNSFYMSKSNEIQVFASSERSATDEEIELFEKLYKSLTDATDGETFENKGIVYTAHITTYYTITATEATVDSSTDFISNEYYTLSGTTYTRSNEYAENTTYYTIEATVATVDSSTDFDANTYYVLDSSIYTKASNYSNSLSATYLNVNDIVAYISNASKISNVTKYDSSSDLSILDDFVKAYIESLNA